MSLKIGKGYKKTFSKEDIQMASKCKKRCLISLREVKITLRYYSTPTTMAIIRKTEYNKY